MDDMDNMDDMDDMKKVEKSQFQRDSAMAGWLTKFIRPSLCFYIQGVFFDWSPLKCLSMELALPPQFQTGPPPTQNVIKFVKELQYNT